MSVGLSEGCVCVWDGVRGCVWVCDGALGVRVSVCERERLSEGVLCCVRCVIGCARV